MPVIIEFSRCIGTYSSAKFEYVKLNRKILDWEWYQNVNTKILFIHCILKANWREGKFEGTTVPRGSFVTSVKRLSMELGLSNDEIRTAMRHLLETGEITKQTTNKYTVITVCNYCLYQDIPNQNANSSQTDTEQLPDNDQTITKPLPTIEEFKKGRNKEYTSGSKDPDRQTDVRRAVDAWNDLQSYGIKPVSKLSSDSKRYQSLVARIRQHGFDQVLAAIEKIKVSDFLQGKGGQGWVITFDWFVKPGNFPKVLEGNYDNRKTVAAPGSNRPDYSYDPPLPEGINLEVRDGPFK